MYIRAAVFGVGAALAGLCSPASGLEVEALWRVSVASDGTQSSNSLATEFLPGYWWGVGLSNPSISADGRYVAFTSDADNLVADDTNASHDAFVHVLATGETRRVSLASDGTQTDSRRFWGFESASVSNTGDVAFNSSAWNLVPADTNGSNDVFVHSLATGVTERVSLTSTGAEALSILDNDGSIQWRPEITPDGRFVVYASRFSDLIADDTNEVTDIFVRDRLTNETSLVTVDDAGLSLGGTLPDITPDGRYVAFEGPGPADFYKDIYVKDRLTGELWLESLANDGAFLRLGEIFGTGHPSISDDGRFVVFHTDAPNVVPAGTDQTVIALRDRLLHTTTPIIVGAREPTISGDGRFVTASIEWDICAPKQLLVHDRVTGQTIRVSVDANGRTGNGDSEVAALSRDGRLIAFNSASSNLVDDDTNGIGDVFVARIGDGNGPRGSLIDLTDTDGDGTEDDCDIDDDNDGVGDWYESYFGFNPLDPSDAALDIDGDGLTIREEANDTRTDPTNPDTDADTVLDGSDNCPLSANTDQANFDGDAEGDACDGDDDNDGYPDWDDAFPFDATRPSVGTTPAPSSTPAPTPTPAPTATTGSSGGGGAVDAAWLLLLSLAFVGRRYTRIARRSAESATQH